ncbi:ParA family protein [Pseudomaricurvus alkylphenolicus]|uniref:ParA family protein n=1 Tax=Pseudomaricurvus alkylphenolicus TaxID=1306991 RepID=UPI0014225AE7|nr:ParA family protein [Pseudomaricurvus alkylphenolicus]NIB39113.1 ParA family protein [Pseudomaricurvus alkylphenolicus]
MKRVVFNQKGGVGKSSITCNLAAISAARGAKTLVVDLDVQGNSSHYLGYEPDQPGNGSVADFLDQRSGFFSVEKAPAEFVHATPFENLYLLPASPKLAHIEKDLESRYKIYKLRDALVELAKDYEEIYIDTPPNLNFYSKSALIAAEELLIPFDCDSFSLQALHLLLENVFELKSDHNQALEVGGIVVNQYQGQARLPRQLIEAMQGEQLPIYNTFLPASVKMKESHSLRKPLPHMAARHKLTLQFELLHDDVMEGRHLRVEDEPVEQEPAEQSA